MTPFYFLSSMSSNGPVFEKLGPNNYAQWCGEMKAWLKVNQLWRLVSGKLQCPPSLPAAMSNAAIDAIIEDWELKSDMASGWLYLMVEPEQRVHLQDITDDAVAIWNKLESVHMAECAGAHLNAYDIQTTIRKKDNNNLQSLTNQIDDSTTSSTTNALVAIPKITSTTPTTTPITSSNCAFCGIPNHMQSDCWRHRKAIKLARNSNITQ